MKKRRRRIDAEGKKREMWINDDQREGEKNVGSRYKREM